MAFRALNVYHCEHCGSVMYHDDNGDVPHCCNAPMCRAASDFVWEIDEHGLHQVPLDARNVVQEIQLEHRELLRRIADERNRWNRIERPNPSDFAEKRLRLRGLRSDCAAHFLREEQGGYLNHILEASPRLEPEVGRLRADHRRFLARFDVLIDMLDPETPETWKETRADFGRLVHELRTHEAAEMSLVPRAFSDEVHLMGES